MITEVMKRAEQCEVSINAACHWSGVSNSTVHRAKNGGAEMSEETALRLLAAIHHLASKKGALPDDFEKPDTGEIARKAKDRARKIAKVLSA